jgi:CRP/FNR family transcriptional regulator, anaerobic regulatory protein
MKEIMEQSGSAAARVTCSSCGARTSCFGHGADASALGQLDQAVERRLRLATGEYLYRIGDPFRSLYAVRSGCLRNNTRDERGREHVMGFHISGDVVGVGGIGPHTYIFDMCALEPSEVCEVPFDKLEELERRVPALRHNIIKILGRYRSRDARTQSLRREGSAEAKVAGFLLDFSSRFEALGGDPTNFRLPMSRADMGNYLGLSTAAVGRAFARLGERAIAKAWRKTIKVYSIEGLRSLAGGRA